MTQVGWGGLTRTRTGPLALAGPPAVSRVPKCPQGPTEAAGTGASGVLWKNEHSLLRSLGMGEFNSDDHYIYYCGQESLSFPGNSPNFTGLIQVTHPVLNQPPTPKDHSSVGQRAGV